MKQIPEYYFALREDLKDHPEFLPTKANKEDTAFDVRCAKSEGVIIEPFEYVKIPLGFRAFCPDGWWYELKPRSSTFAKKHLHCLYGTIDQNFSMELVLAAQYIPDKFPIDVFKPIDSIKIEFGERIGQIIPVRRQEAIFSSIDNETLDKMYLERGSKRDGFGSTGDK